MTFVKQLTGMAAVGVAMLVGVGLCAPEAQAGYTVTLAQVGPDVVATGSGTIDLTGLTYEYEGDSTAGLVPNEANINTGPASFEARDSYSGFTGPTSFGSGGAGTLASSGSGDIVGIAVDSENIIKVPAGYVSGSSLSDMSTYDNQTFASLGVTPGTYTWTWGIATADDTFTLVIPAAAVPEPSSLALLALPLGLLMLLAARRRVGSVQPSTAPRLRLAAT